jgi:signal transduction histidine kinase
MDDTVTCLLVDDLPENLLALSALLAAPGVEVLTAQSGAQALELLLKHEVALALLDVQMPEMDGFELAELMRGAERTRGVPIIFVTAGTHDQARVFQGYDLGAVDFVFKPIEPHVIRSKAGVFFELWRQKKRLARELAERTETLRHNELFVAILGHDLRGPLSAITMSAMVAERKATDEATRRSASRILASARHMGRMIGDLLDLTRTRLGGGMPLDLDTVDVAAAVAQTVDEARLAAPDVEIAFTTSGQAQATADPDRIRQLVGNLLGNAVTHGDRTAPVRVTLQADDPAAAIRITVANAGAIPAEVLPRLFDPFRARADRTGRGSGLGLGLYIVRQIARAHGGDVEARSDPASGTAFTVTIARSAA